MASSTRLSFNPMRRSPVMIFTMYLASSGEACDRSSCVSAAFAAGPRAAAISRNLAATTWQAQRWIAGLCPARTGGGARPHVGLWSRWEHRFRHRAQVSNLAIGGGELGFAFPGELQPLSATALFRRPAAWFPPRRETAFPKEIRRRGMLPRARAPSGIRQRSQSSRVSWWCLRSVRRLQPA